MYAVPLGYGSHSFLWSSSSDRPDCQGGYAGGYALSGPDGAVGGTRQWQTCFRSRPGQGGRCCSLGFHASCQIYAYADALGDEPRQRRKAVLLAWAKEVRKKNYSTPTVAEEFANEPVQPLQASIPTDSANGGMASTSITTPVFPATTRSRVQPATGWLLPVWTANNIQRG